MLSKECFGKWFLATHACLGYAKKIETQILEAIYMCAKDLFDDDEFEQITKQVIQECKCYNTLIPLAEWTSRRKLKTDDEKILSDLIEWCPTIKAKLEYSGLEDTKKLLYENLTERQKEVLESIGGIKRLIELTCYKTDNTPLLREELKKEVLRLKSYTDNQIADMREQRLIGQQIDRTEEVLKSIGYIPKDII